jgi:IS605 OrfB family transposase
MTKLSFKIKLNTNEQEQKQLKELMVAYNNACNYISQIAFEKKVFNNFSLHHLCYKDVRKIYNLPAQFTIYALAKVADAYKTELTKSHKEKRELSLCKFKKYSAVTYDYHLLSYGKNNIISIKTLETGRLKVFGHIYDNSKIPFFKGEADLIYINKKFYIVQTIDVPTSKPKDIKDYLGIDLGIVKISTDSDGDYYSGDIIERKRLKYNLQRQRLQKVNTKSSKRHLKKMSNKEARFRKDVNHYISKQIVEKAEHTSQGIALENLVQFFDKTRVRKEQRNSRASWSFFQLRNFINYKSILKGIPIVLVNPRDTSKRCNVCGCIDSNNRKSQSEFKCVSCGHTENADINAAKNIKYWAAVNQPIVSACSAS